MKKKLMISIILVLVVFFAGLLLMAEKNIYVKRELIANKDIDEVWAIMGGQFTQVHLWSANFKNSKAGGTSKLSELDYLHRITLTERGETIQEVDVFDTDNYSLTYHISKGAPAIAKSAIGIWSLSKMDSNKTKIVMEFKLETNGSKGFLLSPIIKMKLGKSAMEIAEELKYYVEKKTPHPRKIKSQRHKSSND
jgi:hypothetical protein